jgi:organic hydroperoxide reductase OsmC/OhrA
VLSFRAVARASKLEWTGLDVNVEGKLDRVEGKAQFVEYHVHATLRVPAGTDEARATKLLEKAEHVCLISNSLVGQRHLHPTVIAG